MKNSIELFKYKSMPIFVKYWFFLLFFLFSPIKVLFLFISVLIHELAHSIMANKLGYKTYYIVIDALYGGTLIDEKFKRNNLHCIKIALAGPILNIILAILLYLSYILINLFTTYEPFLEELTAFIAINLIIGSFNLLPLYPLDGGRVTKALFRIKYHEKVALRINSILTATTSLTMGILCIMSGYWILLTFCLLFLVVAYTEWNKGK